MNNENNNTAVKKNRPKWVYILIAVAVVVVIDLILLVALRSRSSETPDTGEAVSAVSETTGDAADADAADAAGSAAGDAAGEGETAPNAALTQEQAPISIPLDHGLEITGIGPYTGAYVEDGTDEVVSGVLMVTVTNTGDEYIQYGEIALQWAGGEGNFSLSTLMPGESVVLLELDRGAYAEAEEYTAQASSVATFSEAPSLQEDKLELGALDGALNVTNISGEDISGDVVIYYKNYAAGMYYGGITYRVRIEGGMAAGEIKQIMSEHFSASGSRVVFVTVG